MGTLTWVFHIRTQTQVPYLYLVILIWKYWEMSGMLLPLLLALSCLVQKCSLRFIEGGLIQSLLHSHEAARPQSHELQVNIFYIECSGAVYWVRVGTSVLCSFFQRSVWRSSWCFLHVKNQAGSPELCYKPLPPLSGQWISVLWAPAPNFWPPTSHVQGSLLPSETADGAVWSDFHKLCFQWRGHHMYGVRYMWVWYFLSLSLFFIWRVCVKF